MRQVGWAQRQVHRAGRFQQRHGATAFSWAVMQKLGKGSKATLMTYYAMTGRGAGVRGHADRHVYALECRAGWPQAR
jgi:hypothetical protein